MIQVSYPGVYVQEKSSGVHTIAGVSTSVAAFVGYFSKGPMNEAVKIVSLGDFYRIYGPLHKDSEAGYGIIEFFQNGGQEAYVVRTASGSPGAAKLTSAGITIEAANEGTWGGKLRLVVNPGNATDTFNLRVNLHESTDANAKIVASESYLNLSVAAESPRNLKKVVSSQSELITVTAVGTTTPKSNGTISGSITAWGATEFTSAHQLEATIGSATHTISLGKAPESLQEGRSLLEAAIRAADPTNKAFTDSVVEIYGTNQLRIIPGRNDGNNPITFADATGDTVTAGKLELKAADTSQQLSPEYLLVAPSGADGSLPGATELIGTSGDTPTGMYALRKADLFNILCIPRAATLSTDTDKKMVMERAIALCEEQRAFFIIDTPKNIDSWRDIKDWVETNSGLRSSYAAIYYPRLMIADPLDENRLRDFGASGSMAGLYARTDRDRGVFKAPAGTAATLKNIATLEDVMTDPENGQLNPRGINCIRQFPEGYVSWGARTMRGDDNFGSEWKYVPIRRLALYLEESLFRGTKWVVFEPNDEPLWAKIRLNVGAFMKRLFREGAFQGDTPDKAYYVKCDSETTTQNDRNLGIVNIQVGFAPLKPAEFVVITIQQIAGEL